MKMVRVKYDMSPEEAYIAGLQDAMDLVNEEREAEGGEACCCLKEIVVLDNTKHRIDQHRLAFEMGAFDK